MPHKIPEPVTGEEISVFFPDSDLTKDELEDVAQTINRLLADTCLTFDQERRKHHYLKNLQAIQKHLIKASESMQVYVEPLDKTEKVLPTNATQDIGLTFDDWVYINGLIIRLDQAASISTMKALNKKLFSKFFYELHAILRGIDSKLTWHGRGELTKFEEIAQTMLAKMNIQIAPDRDSKDKQTDITEETIKGYIKQAKRVYQTNRAQRKS